MAAVRKRNPVDVVSDDKIEPGVYDMPVCQPDGSVVTTRVFYDDTPLGGADRLWVGPERQAWMERDTGQQEVGWLAHAPLFPEREQDGADMYGVVLGVDGRWRWTLDLGIEPR